MNNQEADDRVRRWLKENPQFESRVKYDELNGFLLLADAMKSFCNWCEKQGFFDPKKVERFVEYLRNRPELPDAT